MPDGGTSGEQPRTLWIGDLGYWMDETFLYNLFVTTGAVTSVKIIRSKTTNVSEGYGFIEFTSHEAAAQILSTYNGCPIPGTDQIFRLNWAAFGVGKGSTEAADHSVFVGDLAPDVTDYVLQEHFRQYFPTVRSAKVITDPLTSRSKGYGFVRFGSEAERDRALGDMSGHFISNRPIRVSLATAKKSVSLQQSGLGTGSGSHGMQGALGDLDPSNTTLFIGGLSAAVTEDQLRAIFQRFGEIVYVKIPAGKGCGFVQFMGRANAEAAMLAMNGQMVGSTSIRISWGRSSANRHAPSLGVVAPSSYAQQLPPAYGARSLPGGGYGGYDPSALAGAYGTPPYGGGSDPYTAFYAQQAAAAAAAAVDPYAAYQLYGSPVGPGPLQGGQMPVASMGGGGPGFGGGPMGGSAGFGGGPGGALGGQSMGVDPHGGNPMGGGGGHMGGGVSIGGGAMGSGTLGGPLGGTQPLGVGGGAAAAGGGSGYRGGLPGVAEGSAGGIAGLPLDMAALSLGSDRGGRGPSPQQPQARQPSPGGQPLGGQPGGSRSATPGVGQGGLGGASSAGDLSHREPLQRPSSQQADAPPASGL